MRFPIRLSSIALLICALLSATVARSQSLSITNRAGTNYWIEASAPLANPYTLQASGNLHLWVDIHSEVEQHYSFQFNNAGVSQRYFRLITSPPPPPPIRVLLIGDSMTSDVSGWGAGIYGYFKPNATVVNYANAWMSTKVFLASAEWDKMLLITPDYVLLQFGFMDTANDPDRSTTPDEFVHNLRTIVQTVRGFNGVPILVTVHAARDWDNQGKLQPSWVNQNNLIKQVAAELKTPLIDLNKLTTDLLNELGPSGSAFMQLWPDDLMHLSPLGAQYVARQVVNALPDDLGAYLTGIFDPPPKP